MDAPCYGVRCDRMEFGFELQTALSEQIVLCLLLTLGTPVFSGLRGNHVAQLVEELPEFAEAE